MKKRSFSRSLLTALLLAALLAALLTLASCHEKDPSGDASTTADPIPVDTLPPAPVQSGLILAQDHATEYRIIRATDSESPALLRKCNDLVDAINANLLLGGGNYVFPDRDNTEVTEYEILVGRTNRAESADVIASLAAKDFTITAVGKKLVIAGSDDDASVEAVTFFIENFVNGSDSLVLPDDFCYRRSKAPQIVSLSQEDYYWDLANRVPDLDVEVSSPDGSAPALASFTVDGRDVSSQVSADGKLLRLSGVLFNDGMHTAQVTLKAADGSLGYGVFHFGTGECSQMNLYKGEVHAHTTDSDGTGTVEEAYKYARDTAHLDFFAVTDHSDSYAADKFVANHIPIADSFNQPGKFVALYGYEETYSYTSGYFGHLNTINTPVYAVRSESLPRYYMKMSAAEGAIVQFNHPGYSWGNFLEYGLYSPVFDKVVNLYEFKGSSYDNEWALCLAKGWHVSPMHNEDNHSGQWGTVNEAVGYVLAPSLTRQNITEAMTMNRSYTTTDQSLKIYFKINDTWMGGRLNAPEELNVSVSLSTSKTLGTVDIVAEDNIVVASAKPGNVREFEWNLTLSPEFDYYYVRVNGGGFAVTAPVWVENRNKINITGMDRSLISYANSSAKDHRVSVAFTANEAMTDVTVRFYQSDLSGFNLATAPIGEKKIGAMAAGTSAEAYTDVAYSASSPRVTAIVTGKIGDKVYSDTYYLQLTPLLFTEIAASAKGYSYIELYNATADPIELSKYKIRLWPKTGAKSDALAEKTFTMSGTIQPHSVLVLWMKTNDALTLEDFNAKYQSKLAENSQIVALKSPWDAPVKNSTQIEILNGSTVISRAQYNYALHTDVSEGLSVTFTYQTEYTLTAVKSQPLQRPTPGIFDAALMPALIDKAS